MPRSSAQAVLLVDGYNIIGAWSDLQQTRDRLGLEEARRQLIETLVNYSAWQDYDTQIVFDAQYRNLAGDRERVTKHLSVYYTDFGQTADTYIEKSCAAFRHDLRKFHQRLIVATSDRAQQLTVVGYGAEWMSAQRLAAEVSSATHRTSQKQRAKKPTGRFLANSLDPAAKQQLAKLRLGLPSEEP